MVGTRAAGAPWTVVSYDALGNRTAIDDPEMGRWTYTHNAFGELAAQADAKGAVTRMAYDALGRMVSRTSADGTSRWTYGTAANAIGALARVTGPDGFAESYAYDRLGRPASVTRSNGATMTVTTAYDGLGRVASTAWPGGFSVERRYNAHGFLESVRSPPLGHRSRLRRLAAPAHDSRAWLAPAFSCHNPFAITIHEAALVNPLAKVAGSLLARPELAFAALLATLLGALLAAALLVWPRPAAPPPAPASLAAELRGELDGLAAESRHLPPPPGPAADAAAGALLGRALSVAGQLRSLAGDEDEADRLRRAATMRMLGRMDGLLAAEGLEPPPRPELRADIVRRPAGMDPGEWARLRAGELERQLGEMRAAMEDPGDGMPY